MSNPTTVPNEEIAPLHYLEAIRDEILMEDWVLAQSLAADLVTALSARVTGAGAGAKTETADLPQ